MNGLRIITCPVGVLKTNCYLLANGRTGEVIIIDPGAEAKKIREKINELNLKPSAILLTHGHFDHIMAAEELRGFYSIEIMAGEKEKELLSNAAMNVSVMMKKNITLMADRFLSDNEILKLTGFDIRVINTPGHTEGGVCFFLENENILFSGDTLFRDGIGRTDFPTGDLKSLTDSIINRIFSLPEATAVYPGHGEPTMTGTEKRWI